MSRMSALISSFAALLATVASAQSENPRQQVSLIGKRVLGVGIEPSRYPKRMLLKESAIQKEIKITSEQMERWDKAQEKLFAQVKSKTDEIYQNYRDARARQDNVAKAMWSEELSKNANKNVQKIDELLVHYLEPRQFKRLDQIQIQAEGQYSFTRPEIQKRLNLSPGQIALIEPILEQSREEGKKVSLGSTSIVHSDRERTPEERRAHLESKTVQTEVQNVREAILKVRERTMLKIVKLLTRGQREMYLKMRGEPFDFTPSRPGVTGVAAKSESK